MMEVFEPTSTWGLTTTHVFITTAIKIPEMVYQREIGIYAIKTVTTHGQS
jgi:hypothetical protein